MRGNGDDSRGCSAGAAGGFIVGVSGAPPLPLAFNEPPGIRAGMRGASQRPRWALRSSASPPARPGGFGAAAPAGGGTAGLPWAGPGYAAPLLPRVPVPCGRALPGSSPGPGCVQPAVGAWCSARGAQGFDFRQISPCSRSPRVRFAPPSPPLAGGKAECESLSPPRWRCAPPSFAPADGCG